MGITPRKSLHGYIVWDFRVYTRQHGTVVRLLPGFDDISLRCLPQLSHFLTLSIQSYIQSFWSVQCFDSHITKSIQMAQPITIPGPYDPGLPPPPGVEPYFFSPFTLQPYYAETCALCAIVVTIMVVMRVYTKAFVMKSLTIEDFSCVVGWAAFIVYMGLSDSIGLHGGGTHQWDLYFKDVQYHKWLTNYGDMVSTLFPFSNLLG